MRQTTIFDDSTEYDIPVGPFTRCGADAILSARYEATQKVPPMPALTISQPWASMFPSRMKWVENRPWRSHYLGPLLIHAGKGSQYLTKHQLKQYATGAIIGVCEMIGCVDLTAARRLVYHEQSTNLFTLDQLRLIVEHEYTEGPFCWIVRNCRPLRPIACKGKQKLWIPGRTIQREVARQRPDLGAYL
jgi:hypothetical protein